MASDLYPVDYDAIRKGDVIARGEVTRILGEQESDDLQLATVSLADRIQKELWDRGKPWTVCIRKGEIHILTDSDASEYNRKEFASYSRRMAAAHKQNAAVDVGNLLPDERRQHDRALMIQGVMLASMIGARRAAVRRGEPAQLLEE